VDAKVGTELGVTECLSSIVRIGHLKYYRLFCLGAGMANIGALLKAEISRLAKKSSKAETADLRRAATRHRHEIATLRRSLGELERKFAQLSKQAGGSRIGAPQTVETEASRKGTRFVRKGLKSLRARLGLSAGEFADLIGVSAQTVYNWESGTSRPRAAQRERIVSLRSVAKSRVREYLDSKGRGRPKGNKEPLGREA
jgi:hypothetical protein